MNKSPKTPALAGLNTRIHETLTQAVQAVSAQTSLSPNTRRYFV